MKKNIFLPTKFFDILRERKKRKKNISMIHEKTIKKDYQLSV